MAKLSEQMLYTLTLNQEELNILYRVLIDSAYSSDDIVYNMAEVVVNGVDNFECDDESLQPNLDEEDEDLPF